VRSSSQPGGGQQEPRVQRYSPTAGGGGGLAWATPGPQGVPGPRGRFSPLLRRLKRGWASASAASGGVRGRKCRQRLALMSNSRWPRSEGRGHREEEEKEVQEEEEQEEEEQEVQEAGALLCCEVFVSEVLESLSVRVE